MGLGAGGEAICCDAIGASAGPEACDRYFSSRAIDGAPKNMKHPAQASRRGVAKVDQSASQTQTTPPRSPPQMCRGFHTASFQSTAPQQVARFQTARWDRMIGPSNECRATPVLRQLENQELRLILWFAQYSAIYCLFSIHIGTLRLRQSRLRDDSALFTNI